MITILNVVAAATATAEDRFVFFASEMVFTMNRSLFRSV